MQTEIPIFFSTDDNYIPYLDVAVSSLIENASKDYQYRIVVLNTGLRAENVAKVKNNECPGFSIEFVDISSKLENIMAQCTLAYECLPVTDYKTILDNVLYSGVWTRYNTGKDKK